MKKEKKKEKNKNSNKIKVIISLIVIMIILLTVLFGCSYKKENNENLPTNTVEVVDTIGNYGYHLEDRDTEIFKEKYEELKEVLEQDEINYEKYAELITQLFLIDLYTIDNKISKYDVGALDFIYESEQEKFKNKLLDTMYKLVEDNSTNSRKQELPIVKDVEIKKIVETKYKKDETNLNGYQVEADISYEKDLKYDKSVIVTLTKEDNKLYVVNISPKENKN